MGSLNTKTHKGIYMCKLFVVFCCGSVACHFIFLFEVITWFYLVSDILNWMIDCVVQTPVSNQVAEDAVAKVIIKPYICTVCHTYWVYIPWYYIHINILCVLGNNFITSARRYCDRACFLVGSFVHYTRDFWEITCISLISMTNFMEIRLYFSRNHKFVTGVQHLFQMSPVLGKILFTCIFNTDTDTWSQMYLRYRYKILYFNCIEDTDTTKRYLDTRYIEDGYSLIGMFKCYFFNKMLLLLLFWRILNSSDLTSKQISKHPVT